MPLIWTITPISSRRYWNCFRPAGAGRTWHSPWNSRTCPVCEHRARGNRRGEVFRCLQCGYTGDADHVGALNARRLGEERLGDRMEGWRKECLAHAVAAKRRRAAAKRRGDAQAAKARARRERVSGGALGKDT